MTAVQQQQQKEESKEEIKPNAIHQWSINMTVSSSTLVT